MEIVKCLIAGLKVSVGIRFDRLRDRSMKYRCEFSGKPDITVIPDERKFSEVCESNPELTPETVEYIVTGSMFYYKLLKFGGFMLHSSTIAKNGKAYIFSADSGTGKSTHTALWQKYLSDVTIINDDKPAIKLRDGVFYAVGTPWSGKNDQNENIAVPVGGLVLLNRGQVNTIRPATPVEAVPFLMRQTMFPTKPENTELLSELLDKFLTTVPTYYLECDISEEAVKTSFEALTGEKYIKGK